MQSKVNSDTIHNVRGQAPDSPEADVESVQVVEDPTTPVVTAHVWSIGILRIATDFRWRRMSQIYEVLQSSPSIGTHIRLLTADPADNRIPQLKDDWKNADVAVLPILELVETDGSGIQPLRRDFDEAVLVGPIHAQGIVIFDSLHPADLAQKAEWIANLKFNGGRMLNILDRDGITQDREENRQILAQAFVNFMTAETACALAGRVFLNEALDVLREDGVPAVIVPTTGDNFVTCMSAIHPSVCKRLPDHLDEDTESDELGAAAAAFASALARGRDIRTAAAYAETAVRLLRWAQPLRIENIEDNVHTEDAPRISVDDHVGGIRPSLNSLQKHWVA